ncbi:MAG: hypothetical protein ACE5GM_08710, partial [bacterium]
MIKFTKRTDWAAFYFPLFFLAFPVISSGRNFDKELSRIESSSGRYQFIKDQSNRQFLVIDSQTGQVWQSNKEQGRFVYRKIPVEGIKSEPDHFSVYVVGSFAEAGEYRVKQGNTVLQLFSRFGRYFQRIDWKNSKLIRNNQNSTTLKLRDLLIKGDLSANLTLASDDTFFIKLLDKQKENLFKNKIRIIGEVKNQGVIN